MSATAASLIELQVPAANDQQVLVRVSNRGQFSPSSWYTLLVQEMSGDPWERDDEVPKPIALGELQLRSFDPQADVDQVSLAPDRAGGEERAAELRSYLESLEHELAAPMSLGSFSQYGSRWMVTKSAPATMDGFCSQKSHTSPSLTGCATAACTRCM